MKYFEVEYAYMAEGTVESGFKMFRYDDEQQAAEEFCREVKAKDGGVNIKIVTRDDPQNNSK